MLQRSVPNQARREASDDALTSSPVPENIFNCHSWQLEKTHTLGPRSIGAGTMKKAKYSPIIRVRSQHMPPVDMPGLLSLETGHTLKELQEVACRYW